MMNSHPCALLLVIAALGLSGCGERAQLPVSAGVGPDPALPPPEETLLPTVNIAPATGWPEGATPVAAQGLTVASFADRLDCQWVQSLHAQPHSGSGRAPAPAGLNGGGRTDGSEAEPPKRRTCIPRSWSST